MMKRIVLIIAVLATTLIAQTKGPPNPNPPNAQLVECAQQVVTAAEMQSFSEIMRSEGCNHTEFDYIWDGFYLGRGTKIVITP